MNYRVVLDAQETYLPSGPPWSPLTGSSFTTWAFYDLRFGPDRETIGTCLLDAGEPLGLGPDGTEAIGRMSQTRISWALCVRFGSASTTLHTIWRMSVSICRLPLFKRLWKR